MIWESISPGQEITLLLVLLACILWITEVIPLHITSFVLLFLELVWLMPVLKNSNPKISSELFLAPFFSDTILLFLGGFVLAKAANKYEIDSRLAKLLLSSKSSTSFKILVKIIFISSLLSMWMNNTATASLMIGLLLPVLKMVPLESHRKALILAVPFASNIGGIGTPVGTLPNAIAMEYLRGLGLAPSFLEWMIYALPLVLILNFLLSLILYLFFFTGKNKENGEIQNFVIAISDIPRSRKIDVFINAIILLTITLWLTSDLHNISIGTIALIPVILLFSSKILDLKDFKSLSWEVLILMGGGISLGKSIEVSQLGPALLEPFHAEYFSMFLVLVFFSFATLSLSAIMSNTSVANLMVPIAIGLGLLYQDGLVIFVALAASLSMPLPISTPPNAIAFSIGVLKSKEMFIPGLCMTLTAWGLLISFGYYWMKILQMGNL
jgi:solute carrier family 13 (sodium-dependent dicarboxylate transporter), member 2/3/5